MKYANQTWAGEEMKYDEISQPNLGWGSDKIWQPNLDWGSDEISEPNLGWGIAWLQKPAVNAIEQKVSDGWTDGPEGPTDGHSELYSRVQSAELKFLRGSKPDQLLDV